MKLKYIFLFLFFVLAVIVFKNWFISEFFNAGDFTLLITDPSFNLFAWGKAINGMGGSMFSYNWLSFVINFPYFIFKYLHLNLSLAQKIGFFYSFIVLAIFSSGVLYRKMFTKNNFYFLSSLIFLFNTYVLMLVGGGQIFIALSIAFLPITLFFYIDVINKKDFVNTSFLKLTRQSLLTGLLLTVQIMLDLRIGYIAILAISTLLVIFNLLNFNKKIFIKSLFLIIFPLVLVLLLNLYWILPIIAVGQNPIEQLGSAYSTVSGVVFFSFAKLENTISLLHPNWPENIFGKVYFLKPEFLILPLLAFCSLLFIKKINKNERFYVLYFALIGLIGIFLAKGSNDPFGGIYLWLFNHFPGMQMFRDPTKFYTLIVLSYSILIPFSISKIYDFINLNIKNQNSKIQLKIQKPISIAFVTLVILYLIFLIRSAVFGQLSGTFKPAVVPTEYKKLENFISSQGQFSRTLWVPTVQRFGLSTNRHPAISANQFFNTSSNSAIFLKFNNLKTKNLLQESAIKYVIIPYDSEGEIFLEDRKYSEADYLNTINRMNGITWLNPIEGFGKIKVFEVNNPRDHFYISDKQQEISDKRLSYKYISPVAYNVNLKNIKNGDLLIFSESFDKNWSLITDNSKVQSKKYSLFNSFELKKEGSYSARIYYEPQKYVDIGLIVSGVALFSIIFLLGFGYVSKKW